MGWPGGSRGPARQVLSDHAKAAAGPGMLRRCTLLSPQPIAPLKEEDTHRFFPCGVSPRTIVPLALLCATLAASAAWTYTCNGLCMTANNCPATGHGCEGGLCCYCCAYCLDTVYDETGWQCDGGLSRVVIHYYLNLYNCYAGADCHYTQLESRGPYYQPDCANAPNCTCWKCELYAR